MSRLRVLLVDDHPIVLDGLRSLIAGAPDIEVVGSEMHAGRVVARARELAPDLVLVDIKLGAADGIDLCRELKALDAGWAVVLLSSYWDAALVQRALDARADGYLLKDAEAEHLLQAIRDAGAGRQAFDEAVSAEIVRLARSESSAPRFSERDRELLTLVARGLANKQIAAQLRLSPYTVRDRLSELMLRLGTKNRAELVHVAQQRGLI